MVTKQEESTSVEEPQQQETGDLFIDDSTSPEVLEKEAAFVAGVEQSESEGAAEEPEAGAPEGAVEPAAVVEPQPVVEPEPIPEVRPERVYKQDEWDKRQSSWDRQQVEIARQVQELRQKETERSLEADVAARVRMLENQYAPSLGAEEAARVAQAQAPSIREGVLAQEQLRAAQSQLQASQTQQGVTLLGTWAQQLKQTHSLTNDDVQSMMAMVSPAVVQDEQAFMSTGNAMQQLAMRLGQAATVTTQAQKERIARVPPATPDTRLESGDSEVAPDSDDARAERIMGDSNWNQLSAEDKAFMRRRVGADF